MVLDLGAMEKMREFGRGREFQMKDCERERLDYKGMRDGSWRVRENVKR